MASFAGGTDCAAGWASCFELQTRHVRAGGGDGSERQRRAPFDPEGVLEHLNATHKVELDIIKRAAFALEERNAGLGAAPGGGT